VHRAAHYLSIFGKDGLDVGLGHHSRVEVANEDAGVEGTGVILVGHVAGLGLPSHRSPAALPAGRQMNTAQQVCRGHRQKAKQGAAAGCKQWVELKHINDRRVLLYVGWEINQFKPLWMFK